MIYYGDEVGMWGANDPDCRKPMVWSDLEYENETFYPNQETHTPDIVSVNENIREHYKQLIQIRANNLPLQLGDFRPVILDDENDVFAFRRTFDGQSILVVINNSSKTQTIGIKVTESSEFNELLNNEIILTNGEELHLEIEEKWAAILKTIP